MWKRLAILAVILVAFMNVLTFVYVTQSKSEFNNFAKTVEEKTNKVIVYEGKPGYTPVLGKDFFNGKDGLNAMSYSITQTVIKEVPLQGKEGAPGKDGADGKDGKDAPDLEYQFDNSGNFQVKKTGDVFWSNLIPCSKFVDGCTQ